MRHYARQRSTDDEEAERDRTSFLPLDGEDKGRGDLVLFLSTRRIRQARKGYPGPGAKNLNLAVFASFARDIPVLVAALPR